MKRILALVLLLTALPMAALAEKADYPEQMFQHDDRTQNRSPEGVIHYPEWLFNVPEHYKFLPYESNHDPQNQHHAQWKGQDWEAAAWNKNWTPEIAVKKLYENGTFNKQYTRGARPRIPVLRVGPTFYKLSDLDQRRSLKLLADYNQVFEKGYTFIEIRDWANNHVIGSYTPKGMFLN